VSEPEDIFDAVASGDAERIIAVVDSTFKQAAREASARAHARGEQVYDGRAGAEAVPRPPTGHIRH
jgi:hypothetical protein